MVRRADTLSAWAARGLAGAVFAAMALYCVARLELRTDLAAFMPAGSDPVFATLSRHLSDSELSRTAVLTVGADELETAVAGAERVAAGLERHPEVAWVRAGVDRAQAERLYQLYFPHRNAFLLVGPGDDGSTPLDDAWLAERARRLRLVLAEPVSSLAGWAAPADPLLAFPDLLDRIRRNEPTLGLHRGRFVSADRRFAVVFFGTRASAYDAPRQESLQRDLAALVAEAERTVGAALEVEQSGFGRFTVDVRASMERDVRLVAAASLASVSLLFLVFFRSLRILLIALLPSAAGVLTAAAVGTWIFGPLNGFAVAFALSLVGVSIDYSIHLLNHRALAPAGEAPVETARRLRPSLVLGGLTTIASLVGLAFARFPGFDQMGVLATAGVGSALLVALVALPGLAEHVRAAPFSAALADRLGRLVLDLRRRRRAILFFAAVAALVGAASVPHVAWVDDLRELAALDPALLAEDARVRERVSRFEPSRFAVVLAEDWESALRTNDRLVDALERERAAGDLGGFRSLHAFLWSSERQRASEQRLRSDPRLAERLDAVFGAEGFRPGAFAPFSEALARPPPEPLTLDGLRASGLFDLVRPLVVEVEGRRALLTYLEGIRDESSVRAAIEGIPGAHYFDQRRFVRDVYREYRERTLVVVASGCLAVLALLWIRYRNLRTSVAAFLPALIVGLVLAALAAALGLRANLLHLVGLVLVMGMGVDYGIFMVDSCAGAGSVGVTMLSLLLSCLTTVFMFGALALSDHPVLRALGLTAGVGVALAFLLAPLTLALVREPPP